MPKVHSTVLASVDGEAHFIFSLTLTWMCMIAVQTMNANLWIFHQVVGGWNDKSFTTQREGHCCLPSSHWFRLRQAHSHGIECFRHWANLGTKWCGAPCFVWSWSSRRIYKIRAHPFLDCSWDCWRWEMYQMCVKACKFHCYFWILLCELKGQKDASDSQKIAPDKTLILQLLDHFSTCQSNSLSRTAQFGFGSRDFCSPAFRGKTCPLNSSTTVLRYLQDPKCFM